MILFRAMIEEVDSKPKTGQKSKRLGVRGLESVHRDILALNPTDLIQTGGGGMSVAPDTPFNLALFLHTPAMGGISTIPIWVIDRSDLGPDLIYVPDDSQHGLISPARTMPRLDYETALASTRDRWQVYCR